MTKKEINRMKRKMSEIKRTEMKILSDLLHLPLKERIQIAWRIIRGAK